MNYFKRRSSAASTLDAISQTYPSDIHLNDSHSTTSKTAVKTSTTHQVPSTGVRSALASPFLATPDMSNTRPSASLQDPGGRTSWSSSSSSSSSSDNSDDDSLPEFWEEVRLPEGKTLYVDHRTETTTWQRPHSRPKRHSKYKLTDPELVWTARLHAPLPDVPEPRDDRKSPSGSGLANDTHDTASPLPKTGLIADLLRDGYVLGDTTTDFSHIGSVPDFWEVYHGADGRAYYIDHPAGTILRSA